MSIDIKKRKMLLRDFQKGFTAHQAMTHIEEKYGKRGYAIRTCQRWFKKFREGNLNLEEKPYHGYPRKANAANRKAPYNKTKSKRAPQKEVKVESVTFKREQKKPDTRRQNLSVRSEAVQKLIQRKPEITLSKVSDGTAAKKVSAKPNIITQRANAHTTRNTVLLASKTIITRPASNVPVAQKKQQVSNGPPLTMPKLRPIHDLEADLKLPPSIANQMITPQASTECHSIGEGRKSAQKTGETVKKPITVQFQNVNPDIAKNTVRKSLEPAATPLNPIKRLVVPQSTPLSSPKGVIYLNPQEIFKQTFGYPRTLQRSALSAPFAKPVGNLPKIPFPINRPLAASQAAQTTVVVSDSDSEDGLLFPEDISVPAPKVKFVAETFTTYWDMETDKPILLNPAEDPIPLAPVIEID